MSRKTLTRQGALGLLSAKRVEIVESKLGPLLYLVPAYGTPTSILLSNAQCESLLSTSNAKKLEAAEELADSWFEMRPEATSFHERIESDAAECMDKLARIIRGKE